MWTKFSWNHPLVFLSILDLVDCHDFYVCLIAITQVYLEFFVLEGPYILCFRCFIFLPPFCFCLFVGVGVHCWTKWNTIACWTQRQLQVNKMFMESPPLPPSLAFSSLMFGWLVLLLCVPNHHHSNLIGVFCVSGAMSCFLCFISLLHFCSCFFARARANCSLAEAKKHHCQHLQAQCLLQDNKTFMGYSHRPPPLPPLGPHAHGHLAWFFVTYVWLINITHMFGVLSAFTPNPILVLNCLFSNCKCLFDIIMCHIFLFPFFLLFVYRGRRWELR